MVKILSGETEAFCRTHAGFIVIFSLLQGFGIAKNEKLRLVQ